MIRFVLDAADHAKLPTAKAELHSLLEKPQVANIPLLVLGNKNDMPEALTVEQLIEQLFVFSLCYHLTLAAISRALQTGKSRVTRYPPRTKTISRSR
jgi:hypothetical protein